MFNTLKKIIESVEDNNTVNNDYGAKWRSWEGIYHITNTYGIEVDKEASDVLRPFVTHLIENEGEGKEIFLEAFKTIY